MSGRKALVGLSLLCALVFCAFGAASASATVNHTTAFTCVENGGAKDFSDAHCDNKVAEGGKYGHVVINLNTPTEVIGRNNATGTENPNWVLNGVIAGTAIEITCSTIATMASIENNEKSEDVKGSGTIEASGCKLLKPSTQTENCTVTVIGKEATSTTEGMQTKFTPVNEKGIFAEIVLANAPGKTCKGVAGTFNVEGTAIGTGVGEAEEGPTHSGATLRLTRAMTKTTLIFAGSAAELEGRLTFKMGPTGSEGNPIVFTTRTTAP